jgi:molybdate transport system substrate-binding protein
VGLLCQLMWCESNMRYTRYYVSSKTLPCLFMKKYLAVCFGLLLVSFMSRALPARSLTIAIASNFASTFNQLKPLFEKQYHITVNPAFGSTGKLYAQIINGAPFDVFLSADKEHITQLEEKKLSMPGNSFIYAKGMLVLYAPGENIATTGLTQSMSLHMKHIAIANPVTAPYGLATMQFLKRKNLLPRLKSKMVMAENIGQVATFLLTGNVDAGFIANSQLIDIMKHLRHRIRSEEIWTVPQSMYRPLSQYATLIDSSPSLQEARIFLVFLQSVAAKKIIAANGYRVTD